MARKSDAVTKAPSMSVQTGTAGALAMASMQREVAEVQAAMMLARMNPRDAEAARAEIIQACTRPKLAEAALYQYSKGGTDITGETIRLAEVMALAWGNFESGVRELETRDEESVVEDELALPSLHTKTPK